MKIYIIEKKKNIKYDSPGIVHKLTGKTLSYDEKGAPAGLSISHTNSFWLMADEKCGIDIEESDRKINPRIVSKLHPLEQQYMSGLTPGTKEYCQEFLSIWTAKESYLKFTGEGLKQALFSFSVINEDLYYSSFTRIDGFPGAYIHHIDIDKRLICCVSTASPDFECITERAVYNGNNTKGCLDTAAELLGSRAYSVYELKKKLEAKGFGETDIKDAVNKLTELSYLNDEAYAKRLAEKALASGKGSLYIKQKLKKKGIASSEFCEPSSEEQEASALRLALSVIESKGGLQDREYKEKERILAAVSRRLAACGYPSSVVWKIISKIC